MPCMNLVLEPIFCGVDSQSKCFSHTCGITDSFQVFKIGHEEARTGLTALLSLLKVPAQEHGTGRAVALGKQDG